MVVRERLDRAALYRLAVLIVDDLLVLRRRDVFQLVKLAVEYNADVKVLDVVEVRLLGDEDSVTRGQCKAQKGEEQHEFHSFAFP